MFIKLIKYNKKILIKKFIQRIKNSFIYILFKIFQYNIYNYNCCKCLKVNHKFILFNTDDIESKKNSLNISACKDYEEFLQEIRDMHNLSLKVLNINTKFYHSKIKSTSYWQIDEHNAKYWSFLHGNNYLYKELIDYNNNRDIRLAWEKSRMNFLVPLYLDYIVNHDEKSKKLLIGILDDWKRNNPIPLGITWSSAMDVSIRAINLIWLVELEKTYTSDHTLLNLLLPDLYMHGRFVYNNMEFSHKNSNHGHACLLGLLYISLYFDTKESLKWKKKANELLNVELNFAIDQNGLPNEKATNYNKFDIEIFLHSLLIYHMNSLSFPDYFKQKIKKAIQYLSMISNPHRMIPIIGDNDDARIITFRMNRSMKWEFLRALYFSLFEIKQYSIISEDYLIEELLFYELFTKKRKISIIERSELLNEAECYNINKDAIVKNDMNYMFFKCSDIGTYGEQTSHSHNDLLSFVLFLNGTEVICDTGNHSYTFCKYLRHQSISSQSHNTIMIDNREISRLNELPFLGTSHKSVSRFELIEKENHFGMLANINLSGSLVSRNITIDKSFKAININDNIKTHQNTRILWYFHFLVQLHKVSINQFHFVCGNDTYCLHIEKNEAVNDIRFINSLFFPGYNVMKTKQTMLISALSQKDQLCLSFKIYKL